MVDERTLYSGGAPGADSLFGTFAERCGFSEQNYSFRGHVECRSRGRVILTPDQWEKADEDLRTILGDAFTNGWRSAKDPACPARLKYWRRNWYQVANTSQVFAVLNDGTFLDFTQDPPDGAGVAIAIALLREQSHCQLICVYIQTGAEPHWLRWPCAADEDSVAICYVKSVSGSREPKPIRFARVTPEDVRISGGDFTGIGTRQINGNGNAAVKDLYARSFPARW
jgi:hypothetical protein